MAELWNIQLLGGVSVTGPAGPVPIPSRKAKALIALLTLSRGMAVSRSRLAADLWPDHDRKQQLQNLRSLIRVANLDAGELIISADRDTCRLAFEEWKCDAVECLAKGEASEELLAPECPEEALDPWRNELALPAPGAGESSLYKNIEGLLDWSQASEAGRGLDVLFSIREALWSLPSDEGRTLIRKALKHAHPGHPKFSWGVTQLAVALMWSGDVRLVKEAKTLLRSISVDEDTASWTSAVFSTANVIMTQGNFPRAEALLNTAIGMLRGAIRTEAVARLRHGLAHVAAYSGDLARAVRIIQSLGFTDDPEMNAIRLAHTCIYASILRQDGVARETFQRLQEYVDYPFQMRIQTQTLSAAGSIHMLNRRPDLARKVAEEVLAIAQQQGLGLIEIQSLETLSMLSESPTETEAFADQAKALREQRGFPRLPIDDLRAKAVRQLTNDE